MESVRVCVESAYACGFSVCEVSVCVVSVCGVSVACGESDNTEFIMRTLHK